MHDTIFLLSLLHNIIIISGVIIRNATQGTDMVTHTGEKGKIGKKKKMEGIIEKTYFYQKTREIAFHIS